MSDEGIAAVLLNGLTPDERDRVVVRLHQAARDERAAAEAGRPQPFPGPPPARSRGHAAAATASQALGQASST